VGRAASAGTDRQTVPHAGSSPSRQWPLPLACGRPMRGPRPRSVLLRVLRLPHGQLRGDPPVCAYGPGPPSGRGEQRAVLPGLASFVSKRPDRHTRKSSRCGPGLGPNPAERCTLPPTVCRGRQTCDAGSSGRDRGARSASFGRRRDLTRIGLDPQKQTPFPVLGSIAHVGPIGRRAQPCARCFVVSNQRALDPAREPTRAASLRYFGAGTKPPRCGSAGSRRSALPCVRCRLGLEAKFASPFDALKAIVDAYTLDQQLGLDV